LWLKSGARRAKTATYPTNAPASASQLLALAATGDTGGANRATISPTSASAHSVVPTASAFHRCRPLAATTTIGTPSRRGPAAAGAPVTADSAAPPSPTLKPNHPTIASASSM
jgi:hypothetical protein